MACLRTTTVNGHCFTNGNTCIDNVGFGSTIFSNMNSTSRYNTVIGVNSLGATASQCRMNNTVVGYRALNSWNGCLNGATSIGACSQAVSTNATAVGFFSEASTDGVSVGMYSQSETCGVAIGYCAKQIGGGYGIAIGSCACAEGSATVVIGRCDVTGFGGYNTQIGYGALSCDGAGQNTIIGAYTCVGNSSENIIIGRESKNDGSNSILLGSSINVVSSNKIYFNTQYGSGPNYIFTKWNYLSDCRDKTKITPIDYDLGLPLMKKIKPVTFKWDLRDLYVRNCGFERGTKDGTLKQPHIQVGILAQDLEESLQEMNLRFDALKYNESQDKYGLSESAFVSSVVKSVQQLSTRLDVIKTRIENLETV